MKKQKSQLDMAFGLVQHGKIIPVQLKTNPTSGTDGRFSAPIVVTDQDGNAHKMHIDDVCKPTVFRGLFHPANLLKGDDGEPLLSAEGTLTLDPTTDFYKARATELAPFSSKHTPTASEHSSPTETSAPNSALG